MLNSKIQAMTQRSRSRGNLLPPLRSRVYYPVLGLYTTTTSTMTAKEQPIASLIAGATAGGVEAFITYPLESLKTQLQFTHDKKVSSSSSVCPANLRRHHSPCSSRPSHSAASRDCMLVLELWSLEMLQRRELGLPHMTSSNRISRMRRDT